MTKNNGRTQTILMFPWLGHGHISPFLELSKKLTKTNLFNIYICSTPSNLDSIKKKLKNDYSNSIRLIELHLPPLPNLPPHLHTTNGLPSHLMPTLKQAFDMSSSRFSKILETLKPHLLIYDLIQPWAPAVAAAADIPAVVFITTGATMASNMFHLYLNNSTGKKFPFPAIYYRDYEHAHVSEILESSANNRKDKDRVMECVDRSSSIVLIKSFKEIEEKYGDYLSALTGKKIVPVGPLVDDLVIDQSANGNYMIEWLDKKSPGSTIFVSFGSEYFLCDEDLEEIAYGLEMSKVNFIWVVRFPKLVEKKSRVIEDVLPLGFLERVKGRGLIVEGWVPQTMILGHQSVGGFVSHCGWNSIMEAMKFGVPIIAMPMQLDQPVNARLVAEVGVGVEVVRGGDGRLRRERVAAVVREVVVEKGGEVVREKAKKMRVDLMVKGDEEIDVVVEEILKLCGGGGGCGGGRRRRKVEKMDRKEFVVGASCAVKGEV